MRLLIALIALLLMAYPAEAKKRRYDRIVYDEGQIVNHPAGCPRRAFCGCGVSIKVFGHPVKNLFLASNWFKFPRAQAAPGMVAVRHGHVMYIMAMDANGNATVYDPNSGQHRTRIWTRSLAGYTVVNPNGQRHAQYDQALSQHQ